MSSIYQLGFVLIIFLFVSSSSVAHADPSENHRGKAAILLPLTGDAASLGGAFKNGMSLGLENLSDVKDFKTIVSKLRVKEKEYDAILVGLFPGQLAIFSRQLRGAGIKAPMFGWETMDDTNEVKNAGGALRGTWFASANQGIPSFVANYQKKFPNASSLLAANGHDIVLLLAKAFEHGSGSQEIVQFLSTLENFSGAVGTYSATGDQRFSLPAALKIVTENGVEVLSH